MALTNINPDNWDKFDENMQKRITKWESEYLTTDIVAEIWYNPQTDEQKYVRELIYDAWGATRSESDLTKKGRIDARIELDEYFAYISNGEFYDWPDFWGEPRDYYDEIYND